MQTSLDLDNKTVQKPSVLVCQIGARHRYAVPRMLEDAGMLAALYTDSSSLSVLGRLARFLRPYSSKKMRRLAGRLINDVPKEKVFSTDYPLVRDLIARVLDSNHKGIKANKKYIDWLSGKMIKEGTRHANIIYSMNRSCVDFVDYAKSHGCLSIIDVFMHPRTEEIYVEEYRKWPEFGYCLKQDNSFLEIELWHKAFSLADILLCPSEWVAEGVCGMAPYVEDKIRIVPYGCTIDYGKRKSSPVVGSIFFAGGNALGKGLHYLAQAASLLQEDIPQLDVRIAGQLSPTVINHSLCKNLTFLGKLSMEQMKEEYLSADLFVLPSLTEGFAGVIGEAICAGCPVVVTKESGTPIVHGREGFIVRARDTDALAGAIKSIVGNRNLRNDMSEACLAQRDFYSEAAWQKRLIEAIRS